MQKINVVCVGKIKEEFYRSAVNEYLKRLSRFARVEVKELPECKTLDEEAAYILKAVRGRIVALCVEGEKYSSEKLADLIKGFTDRGEEATFIIGSSYGLAAEVKKRADLKLSFSDMTFPHQLMRVILCEQLYRAFMINGGGEYHK
ncbi:MAG TPA: 23S rRNA (pseudouridine(1915)-N(3))-methyltransferase RlmH [Clostridiales bacterium]|nr:23S rRNA (pseudouridine(1915)-N(3))-methyltransferase RlmH [Clostridiales bacterium]